MPASELWAGITVAGSPAILGALFNSPLQQQTPCRLPRSGEGGSLSLEMGLFVETFKRSCCWELVQESGSTVKP